MCTRRSSVGAGAQRSCGETDQDALEGSDLGTTSPLTHLLTKKPATLSTAAQSSHADTQSPLDRQRPVR